jgi:hypothetical protein
MRDEDVLSLTGAQFGRSPSQVKDGALTREDIIDTQNTGLLLWLQVGLPAEARVCIVNTRSRMRWTEKSPFCIPLKRWD